MKNWKTTLSGIVAAIGASMQLSADPTVKAIGAIVIAVGALLFGISAKDNNVTGGTVQQ